MTTSLLALLLALLSNTIRCDETNLPGLKGTAENQECRDRANYTIGRRSSPAATLAMARTYLEVIAVWKPLEMAMVDEDEKTIDDSEDIDSDDRNVQEDYELDDADVFAPVPEEDDGLFEDDEEWFAPFDESDYDDSEAEPFSEEDASNEEF